MEEPKKRPLSEDEKNLNITAIKRLTEANQDMEIQVADIDHKVNYVLPFSLKQQTKEFLNKKREFNENIHNNNVTVIELERQIQEGVVPKKR